jgi:hypothetical protein
MAGYNELLIGRWNRFYQKLTGIKGSKPIQSLGPEVMPVHPLFHGAENRYLESWDLFAFSPSANGGVAAQATSFRIRNPKSSNVVAIIEKLSVQGAVADTHFFDRGADPQTDLFVLTPTLTRMDPRTVRQNPTLIFSYNTAGFPTVALNPQDLTSGEANETAQFIFTDNQEITLLPGDAVQVRANTIAANAVSYAIRWRERALEESERT